MHTFNPSALKWIFCAIVILFCVNESECAKKSGDAVDKKALGKDKKNEPESVKKTEASPDKDKKQAVGKEMTGSKKDDAVDKKALEKDKKNEPEGVKKTEASPDKDKKQAVGKEMTDTAVDDKLDQNELADENNMEVSPNKDKIEVIRNDMEDLVKAVEAIQTTTAKFIDVSIGDADDKMTNEMKQFLKQTAFEAFQKNSDDKLIGSFIKKAFDNYYSPTWQCMTIVGDQNDLKSFKVISGNLFVYFDINKIYHFLLLKTLD